MSKKSKESIVVSKKQSKDYANPLPQRMGRSKDAQRFRRSKMKESKRKDERRDQGGSCKRRKGAQRLRWSKRKDAQEAGVAEAQRLGSELPAVNLRVRLRLETDDEHPFFQLLIRHTQVIVLFLLLISRVQMIVLSPSVPQRLAYPSLAQRMTRAARASARASASAATPDTASAAAPGEVQGFYLVNASNISVPGRRHRRRQRSHARSRSRSTGELGASAATLGASSSTMP